MRALALSVFSQCRRLLTHTSNVKALTGFGTAAMTDLFLKNKDVSWPIEIEFETLMGRCEELINFLGVFRRKTKPAIKRTVRRIYCRRIAKNYEAEARIRIAAATASAAACYLPINNVPFCTLPIACPKTKNGFWFPL